MTELSFALVGFGNVGKAFVRLLQQKRETLQNRYGIHFRVTGIATGRHGMAIDPDGLDLDRVLAADDLSALSKTPAPASVLDFIETCPADVLMENSPTNHIDGQPAIDYLRTALRRGMVCVTANKGPVAHAYRELTDLARQNNTVFMFESSVMDGAPIFSLFRETLPTAELRGFSGILNSCTNLLLGRMENGESLEDAIRYAQSIGIAETDPSGDVDGWDSAIKVAALSTVLMGHPMTPQDVNPTGIRGVTPAMIQEAAAAGERWKLVCRARRDAGSVLVSVQPERVGPASSMFSIDGTSSIIQFQTDVLPGLGIVENDPGPETTAYGLLADLICALRARGMFK
jgi:homoserine dehydrogenase